MPESRANLKEAIDENAVQIQNDKCGVTVSFHDVIYEVEVKTGHFQNKKTTNKTILSDVSGVMEPGLTAIMGPSGSGKTTLLDILGGRKDPTGIKNGRILFNGKAVSKNTVRLSTGYVVQDDVVIGSLTVRENLLFSANLRLPSSEYSESDRTGKVDKLIEDLGLTSCANTKVGNEFVRGISGGERKRTCIGMELVIGPHVLFLDEPTTGLDAYTAASLIQVLKELGRKGKTVILSLHQPRYSIFSMFDQLIILSRGIKIYDGLCSQSVDYFSSIGFTCPEFQNPPDYMLDVVNGQFDLKGSKFDSEHNNPDTAKFNESSTDHMEHHKIETAFKLSKMFANSQIAEDRRLKLKQIERMYTNEEDVVSNEKEEISYHNEFLYQLYYVTQRSIYDLLRYPMSFVAPMLMSVCTGIVTGFIFFQLDVGVNGIQDRAGAIYFLVSQNFFSYGSALDFFITKKQLFIHEKSRGYYRTIAYFLARSLTDIFILRWIPLLALILPSYFLIGFQLDAGKFFFCFILLASETTASITLAFAMSSMFKTPGMAGYMMAIIAITTWVFNGFLINTSSILGWLEWIKWFSIFRYGLNGLLVNEMKGLVFISNSSYPGFDPTSIEPCYSNVTNSLIPDCTTGIDYLERQHIPHDVWGLWTNVVALGVMSVIHSIIAFVQLHFTSIYR